MAPGRKSKALHFTTDHTVRRLGSDRALRASTLTPVSRIEDCSITSLAETVRSSLGWLGQRGSGAVNAHQRESRRVDAKKVMSLDRCRKLPNHRREPSSSDEWVWHESAYLHKWKSDGMLLALYESLMLIAEDRRLYIVLSNECKSPSP